jgi:hypothetical protein
MKRSKRVAMAVVWPAFLMAGVLEILVFSLVDPSSLHGFGGVPVALGATAVYSLAFLVFWVVVGAACAMTQLLAESATEVNSRSFR